MRALVYAALAAVALPQAVAAAPTHGAVPQSELRRQLFMNPGDPVLMAQLAHSYAETGRAERARRLYRAMLLDEDVQLERAGGAPISSHALARFALERLAERKPIQLTSR